METRTDLLSESEIEHDEDPVMELGEVSQATRGGWGGWFNEGGGWYKGWL